MSYLILIDDHDPEELYLLLKQWSEANVVRTGLNLAGMADIAWHDIKGAWEQVELKKWPQLLSDGIEKTEYQLNKHISNGAKTILILEGMATPSQTGITLYEERDSSYKQRNPKLTGSNQDFWVPSGFHKQHYQFIESWLVNLERQGLLVWRTPNTQATAATIIELVKSANKSQLSALARHLKISQPFNINKHVMTLMGVEFPKGQAGIGVILAEALIAHYGTAWNVFNSSPQNIADNIQGMGLVKARQLLSAIGRKV